MTTTTSLNAYFCATLADHYRQRLADPTLPPDIRKHFANTLALYLSSFHKEHLLHSITNPFNN